MIWSVYTLPPLSVLQMLGKAEEVPRVEIGYIPRLRRSPQLIEGGTAMEVALSEALLLEAWDQPLTTSLDPELLHPPHL